MLSQTTRYALQAFALLASRPTEWHGVRELARALDLPANYLSKILGRFSKLGLLESRKGRGGGFRLSRDPSAVALQEIVEPLEGLGRTDRCVFGLPECSDDDPCPLHDHWKRIREVYQAMLSECTLGDLVASKRGPSRPVPR